MNIRHIKNFGQIMSFCDLNNVSFDFYCYPGHPRDIHDEYGSLAVEEFYNKAISELDCFNSAVYRVSTAVFAIPYSDNNPMILSIRFKSKIYEFKRRIVTIKNVP